MSVINPLDEHYGFGPVFLARERREACEAGAMRRIDAFLSQFERCRSVEATTALVQAGVSGEIPLDAFSIQNLENVGFSRDNAARWMLEMRMAHEERQLQKGLAD